ncbi:MAG: hypothetical protein KBD78_02555 [Oligoflexales bacterium]|nr:hypothetical protein [Oligoflexales bacterium]
MAIFKKIDQLGRTIHDDQIFKEIQSILGEFKNTQQRRDLLASKMLQDVINFDNVKDVMWPNENDREKNRFPFLQGDIVATKSVLVPGQAHSASGQSLWLVKSADCDVARVEPFVEVSPLFPVRFDKSKNSEDLMTKWAAAWKLGSDRSFPIPPLQCDTDDSDLAGYIADLTSPGFIRREDFPLVSPINSQASVGWILLKNLLHRRYTRAVHMKEAYALRGMTVYGSEIGKDKI